MANFVDTFIRQYLKNPAAALAKHEFRGLLNRSQVPLKGYTATEILKKMPDTPLLASFVPLMRAIGIRSFGNANTTTIAWAQLITALLAQINPLDQDDIVRRYGKYPSEVVSPTNIIPGFIYTYRYEAAIDIYDQCPMTLVLDRDATSFIGMNFHYLPYEYRFALFEALMPLIAPIPVSQLSSINITYQVLSGGKSFRGYKPTIKRYRLDRMKSNAIFISPIEWAIALAFPSQSFFGQSVQQVWHEAVKHV